MQRENVVNNKVILNLIQNLQRKVVSPEKQLRQAWKTLKQVQGDGTNRNNGAGFTLIELLVVVLIIGILAAVAVPQYTQAVEKSRFATYRALANSMAQAVDVFYLANGTWPTSLDELDMEFPADMSVQNNISQSECRKNNKMFCCLTWPYIGNNNGSVKCGDNDYHLMYVRQYVDLSGKPCNSMSCQAKDEKYKAICKAISGNGSPSPTAASTPDGWKFGYYYYSLD